jgi:hypothetical protein
MQYIAIIKAVLSLLPILIEVIKAIEAAFPQSGQGAAKLEAVRATVASAYAQASDTTVKFDVLWGPLQTAIGAFVALANSTGMFKK